MLENICHFIPPQRDVHYIQPVNFVLETKPQPIKPLKAEALYKMHIVRSGTGKLHTLGNVCPLKKGDVFFTFPAFPFCIESEENFSYMYISFLGTKGNQIMDMLRISSQSFVYSGEEDVLPLWNAGLSVHPKMHTFMCESLLLYTFSHLAGKILSFDKSVSGINRTAELIKKYVDENFLDTDFSLEQISLNLSYNKKYISGVFKKAFGVGIAEYVNTVRIQHALNLIEQGFKSINDIAFCCGYKDPQYFSKVFKQKLKITPGAYIKQKK
ncbi:MAG: helix-turn-helix transcriptional regulator [Clostridia bacterium]|nr:helix-turn-helix transcriptional regulator [Clostridia bacterium]